MTLNVLQIVPGTSVDGPGLRTSVYLAGCTHRCPGCHNPASWDFSGGTAYDVDELANIVIAHEFNVTLSGGDPLQTPDIDALIHLLRRLKSAGLNVWAYTGYTLDEALRIPRLRPVLELIDTLVDGPYVEALRDPQLHFRGSSNQQIIDLRSIEL